MPLAIMRRREKIWGHREEGLSDKKKEIEKVAGSLQSLTQLPQASL